MGSAKRDRSSPADEVGRQSGGVFPAGELALDQLDEGVAGADADAVRPGAEVVDAHAPELGVERPVEIDDAGGGDM